MFYHIKADIPWTSVYDLPSLQMNQCVDEVQNKPVVFGFALAQCEWTILRIIQCPVTIPLLLTLSVLLLALQ